MIAKAMEEIAPLRSRLQFGVTIGCVDFYGLGIASGGNGLAARIAEGCSIWIVGAAVIAAHEYVLT